MKTASSTLSVIAAKISGRTYKEIALKNDPSLICRVMPTAAEAFSQSHNKYMLFAKREKIGQRFHLMHTMANTPSKAWEQYVSNLSIATLEKL
jgi:hypothetical protein